MIHLHQHITTRVDQWRAAGYPPNHYPAIIEILEWAKETQTGHLRFLRRPQLRSLETYWYLRLVEKTPHIFDLYRNIFPKQSELLAALGLDQSAIKGIRSGRGY
jgi:type III restriction enzyme